MTIRIGTAKGLKDVVDGKITSLTDEECRAMEAAALQCPTPAEALEHLRKAIPSYPWTSVH
jgi:hypothetical protein